MIRAECQTRPANSSEAFMDNDKPKSLRLDGSTGWVEQLRVNPSRDRLRYTVAGH
jgi:hypothetical protein